MGGTRPVASATPNTLNRLNTRNRLNTLNWLVTLNLPNTLASQLTGKPEVKKIYAAHRIRRAA